MKKVKEKITQVAKHPKTKEALKSIKPEKNIWGIGGVIVFIILPEVIAYFYGADILKYANDSLLIAKDFLDIKYYELLIMLFEDGVSYFNLLLGIALLIWLFF